MRLDLGHIAAYIHADVQVPPADFAFVATSVTWDSREVSDGCVYFALPGERVDGHDFAESALAAGACAVVASRPLSASALETARARGAAVFAVPSTHDAFTDLARGWRAHLKGTVVGLTGSVGKTTTKNLIRDVLSARFSVVATKANQNNELGVPNTVLTADPDTEMLVVEMGMRGLGQIESLCSFVKPDWGVVTNVGESHIELLGSRDNIARAKSELIAALPTGAGIAFLNGSDDRSEYLLSCAGGAERLGAVVCYNGVDPLDAECASAWRDDAGVWAEDVTLDRLGHPRFTLCRRAVGAAQVEREACTLALRGVHNVGNATAAAAVGLQAGMGLAEVARALELAQPEGGRQEILDAQQGFTVINDAYNASSDSMRASLSLLAAIQVERRRVAVLGDMGELGSFAQEAHVSVGAFAAASGVDCLVCVGELSRLIAQGAREAGMPESSIHPMPSREDALAFLRGFLAPGDVVLVKASHSMELDRIAKGLLN